MKKDAKYREMLVDNSNIESQLDLIAEAVETLDEAVEDLDPTDYTGYDATKTQTLKNVSGTLTWVDDE